MKYVVYIFPSAPEKHTKSYAAKEIGGKKIMAAILYQ
jgi:hypothetical protein